MADAIHLTVFFGETTRTEDYSGLDAQRAARVAVGLDDGFEPYPIVSPLVIADVTGNGDLSGLDAQRIAHEAVGLAPKRSRGCRRPCGSTDSSPLLAHRTHLRNGSSRLSWKRLTPAPR